MALGCEYLFAVLRSATVQYSQTTLESIVVLKEDIYRYNRAHFCKTRGRVFIGLVEQLVVRSLGPD